MATKMIVNEFVAYLSLQGGSKAGVFSDRTSDLLSIALCGFANISSIGIQISVLGAIAPNRTRDLAELATSAMLVGTVSTWLTACVAGALI
ncbi:concentrative nucleoside transporter C-terminal domain-containing protein [Globomyces pollinis-pini]|nr:concentrative nucleoside transporter C-terminal domain-containing protein [Globomyces pollinis-pini]